jgi:branched-chain amino acid transport system substrate-binding protein
MGSGWKFQLIGGGAIHDEEFRLAAGDAAAEGTLTFGTPVKDSEAAARALQAYQQRYPEQPGKPGEDWHFLSYIAFNVWTEAVKRAGSVDPATVSQVLHTQKFDTMLGEIGFDKKGDLAGIQAWGWSIWKNGELVPTDELPSD